MPNEFFDKSEYSEIMDYVMYVIQNGYKPKSIDNIIHTEFVFDSLTENLPEITNRQQIIIKNVLLSYYFPENKFFLLE